MRHRSSSNGSFARRSRPHTDRRTTLPNHHARRLEQADRVVAVRFTFFFVQMLCMFAVGISVAVAAARAL